MYCSVPRSAQTLRPGFELDDRTFDQLVAAARAADLVVPEYVSQLVAQCMSERRHLGHQPTADDIARLVARGVRAIARPAQPARVRLLGPAARDAD